jgi:hypothetical protein
MDIFNVESNDQNSLFEGSNTPTVDPQKDYLAELVGEDKKFKDHQSLARGKVESDLFIESLKRELQELRTDLNSRISVEKALDQLRKEKMQEPNTPSVQPNPGEPSGVKEGITPEKLEQLLQEREIAKRQADNLAEVNRALSEKFGTAASAKLAEKAKELGVGLEYLKNLAAQSPTLFYKAVELETPKRDIFTQGAPRSELDTSKQLGDRDTTGAKTYSYYSNLRRTNPSLYHSPSVQMEMHKTAQRLGEKFFDK